MLGGLDRLIEATKDSTSHTLVLRVDGATEVHLHLSHRGHIVSVFCQGETEVRIRRIY
jgi:hypothetical protein